MVEVENGCFAGNTILGYQGACGFLVKPKAPAMGSADPKYIRYDYDLMVRFYNGVEFKNYPFHVAIYGVKTMADWPL